MAPLRVAHILSSSAFAGIERHVVGLARELRRLGCDAGIVCPASAEQLRSVAHASAIPLPSVRALFVGRAVDIIHVHDGRSALLGTVALNHGRRPAFVRTQHFVRPAAVHRGRTAAALSLTAHRAVNRKLNGYVAVSQAALDAAYQRHELPHHGGSAVIPPGIDVPDDVSSPAASRGPRTPRVVSAGRLEPERRFDILIRAAAILCATHQSYCFTVVGSGSDIENLRSLATRLGVAEVFTWTGWLADVGETLRSGDLYVNTWPDEGFGMATAEAMANGLPVVVTRSGAAQELVDEGISGLLVRPLDPDDLARAIAELAEAPTRAHTMGERARARAVASYSFATVAEQMLGFYERLGLRRSG